MHLLYRPTYRKPVLVISSIAHLWASNLVILNTCAAELFVSSFRLLEAGASFCIVLK